jgi:hypothetical protein
MEIVLLEQTNAAFLTIATRILSGIASKLEVKFLI